VVPPSVSRHGQRTKHLDGFDPLLTESSDVEHPGCPVEFRVGQKRLHLGEVPVCGASTRSQDNTPNSRATSYVDSEFGPHSAVTS
jgi:hypothetical protein